MNAAAVRVRHLVVGWLLSRLALVAFVVLTGYLIGFDLTQRRAAPMDWLAGRFAWADSYHYVRIAELGYLPPGLDCCDQAFFPGYPLLIRAFSPLVGGNATWAGLVVSHLAAVAAVVLLWLLGRRLTGDVRIAVLAVLLLAVTPYGIFLTAVFTESVFLALAVGAWLAGSDRRWWWAGALAGAASLVRVNGLFLAAGLAVMYLIQQRTDGAWSWRPLRTRLGGVRVGAEALALLAPVLAVGGYVTYLYARTGSWTEWNDAQVTGWGRRSAWPWDGLVAGWQAIVGAKGPDFLVAYVADLCFAVAGVVVVAVLLWLRRWPEAVYLGASVAVLIFSTTVQSSPRYALTWFPAYLLVAEGLVALRDRRGWAWPAPALLAACLPLLGAVSVALAAHLWVA